MTFYHVYGNIYYNLIFKTQLKLHIIIKFFTFTFHFDHKKNDRKPKPTVIRYHYVVKSLFRLHRFQSQMFENKRVHIHILIDYLRCRLACPMAGFAVNANQFRFCAGI